MNSVSLIGRITKDPEVRYTNDGLAIAKFSLAISRNDKDKNTDYPNITCFGKTAEIVEKYAAKGKQIGINGRIQTGSYEKDGKKVYTTDVIAERVELLGGISEVKPGKVEGTQEEFPDGFSKITDEDIPF